MERSAPFVSTRIGSQSACECLPGTYGMVVVPH
jgi:hypothetical protein